MKEASAQDRLGQTWRCVSDAVCVHVLLSQSSQCVCSVHFVFSPPAFSVCAVMQSCPSHTLQPHMENEEEEGEQEEELRFGTSRNLGM